MNKPIFQRLTGGYEEVDDKLQRHIEPRETFQLGKWVRVYKNISITNAPPTRAILSPVTPT